MKYFKETEYFEGVNIELSKNLILQNSNKKNTKMDYDYLINNLIYTKESDIQILKMEKVNEYPLKCIIPICNDIFKGSLIVKTYETIISKEIKKSFFRFCYGLFFTIQDYILNGSYEQYRLL